MPAALGQQLHILKYLHGDSLKRELTEGVTESALNH